MDVAEIGRWLVVAGLGIAGLGAGIWLLGRVPFLGRLPGDLSIQVGGVGCFMPLATMLILSLVLTVIANLLLRLFGK